MNIKDSQHPWQRLNSVARRAHDDRPAAAPYGFATRVAAQAMAAEQLASSLFARFSLRALGIACLLMLGSLATNYSVITKALADEEASWSDDPVAELVEVAS